MRDFSNRKALCKVREEVRAIEGMTDENGNGLSKKPFAVWQPLAYRSAFYGWSQHLWRHSHLRNTNLLLASASLNFFKLQRLKQVEFKPARNYHNLDSFSNFHIYACVRLFGLTDSSARSWFCLASNFMNLTAAFTSLIFICRIKLGYLFKMPSCSLILHKQYYVYLQLLLLLGSWKPQGIKKKKSS